MDAVIGEIFGVKFFSKFEFSATEDFFECASRNRLGLLLQRAGKNETR